MVSSFEANLGPQEDLALKFDYLPLQKWGLSSRTLNALLNHNFKMTVGDIIRSRENLTDIRGLGVAGVSEINNKLSLLLITSDNTNTEFPQNRNIVTANDKMVPTAYQSKLLPQSIQYLSLDYLHLDLKTYKALVKAKITTIGVLYNTENSLLGNFEDLHVGSLGDINDCVITLLSAFKDEDDVNWFNYWEARNIQILPSVQTPHATIEQIFRNIPGIIRELLLREADERAWSIIQRRFGLGNTEKLTLEDMGNAFGLTRERIRQIEEKSLSILRKVLIEQHYAGKDYHVHPMIHHIIQTIQTLIESTPSKLILESKLIECLSQKVNFEPRKDKSSFIFLATLIGAEQLEIDYQNSVPLWGYVESSLRLTVESAIKRLDDFLTREIVLPQTEIDILVKLNKGIKKPYVLTRAQLDWLIELCTSVERREDNSVWGKFESLKGRGNQVERILIEAGSPMKIVDIVRQMNHRLVPFGQHRVAQMNLANQIISDGRFIAIGRSGTWGLKSWSHIDTKSILTLMEEYLITQNKSVTADEIFTYVSKLRPVSKHSITIYLLTEKKIFVQTSRTTWGLTKWLDTEGIELWNKEHIAEFVAKIFKKNKANEMGYKVLKEALMKEANINEKQAQGLLNSNPVIRTKSLEAWGEVIAIFQPNYKTMLAQKKSTISHQRIDLYKQIEDNALVILKQSPDKQMPLAELIRQLHKKVESPSATIYNYLKTMDFIEQINIPGSMKKICHLKENVDGSITIALQRVPLRQKISESVRDILEHTPNKQMLLSELIILLQKEHECPKPTLYRYIANLDFIERIAIPNSPTRICRLKDTHKSDFSPQVQGIADPDLRQKVERALPFLTAENVDIGLFLLSKEFEATLKIYLVNAIAKGKLKVLPPGKSPEKWNLIGMVDCVRDNGVINDHATFHFLRQTRNDRAHGTMPSIEEKQAMMQHVEHIAGLYIDYIKILDNLTHSL